MFFVFGHGSPRDGEATGGLGDCLHKTDTLNRAKELGEALRTASCDVEILDGVTGEVWVRTHDLEWKKRGAVE